MSNKKPKSGKAALTYLVKKRIALILILAGLAALFLLSTLPSEPPEFPRDPNYKLPDQARFLAPETQELLRDVLSRIKPIDANDKNNYGKGKKFAKQAFRAYLKLLRLSDSQIEQKAKYCIDNAIAAINLNYHEHHMHDTLAAAVRLTCRKYHSKMRREFIEAANVFDIDTQNLDKLSNARGIREDSRRYLIWALVYHRAAEFDEKFKQNYDDQLYTFKFKWEGYVDFLKKGLTWDYSNLIREGSYEQTIKRIDEIFSNLNHIPEKITYMEFEFHGHSWSGRNKPPKKMMSEEERQKKISAVVDALKHDTTNPWCKIGAYDDFANLMGGFNFMINDPFLNQIMIFSARQHIFEKAADREKKISGQDSFIYKQLLKEASDADYIKKHYELLYKEENGKLPEVLEKVK